MYAKVGDQSGDMLENLIRIHLPEVDMEIYRTINHLLHRLGQFIDNSGIAVLSVTNREELMSILSISYLFRDIRIILITPNREADTIALAHQLRPRFLSDMNSDFEEVAAVLKKMVNEHR